MTLEQQIIIENKIRHVHQPGHKIIITTVDIFTPWTRTMVQVTVGYFNSYN